MNKLEILKNKFLNGNESRILNRISEKESNNIMLRSVKKDPIIIGISGSKGKSTISYLIHNYLKKEGYRSMLYSSIGIDSRASFNIIDEEVENPIVDTQMILDIVEEAIEYDAEYIIMEVNERAIHKGYTNNFPFDIRLLSNIRDTHNTYFYNNYRETKINFFKEASKETTLIFNASSKETFEELYNINSNKKITYMSNYVTNEKEIDRNKVDYFVTSSEEQMDSVEGLRFEVNEESFSTNMLYSHNAINIAGVISVLKEINIYDYNKFAEYIKSITIPGRDEIINLNNRKIIINTSISPQLKRLNSYKVRGEFNKLHLLVGAVGLGYKYWIDEFGEEKLIRERELSISYAFNYLKKYVDSVTITTNDSGDTNKEELINYQASFIDNGIEVKKEIDRTSAIKNILINSSDGDLIYISGRGNRRVMCDSKNDYVLHKDKEVLLEILKEIGWV
ncbi:Mur ligase family protein [Haploplasma modicum]|uniref:Mur ligase family protein n=1 Tax=Haploplasma modicum TaxID=2150 RepID=UPI00047901A0|nr:Mur ligase family protein [Haploplasma modicum]